MDKNFKVKISTFILLLTVIILLIFFSNNSFILFLKNIISEAVYFFGNIGHKVAVGIYKIFTNFILINSVVKENSELLSENRNLISVLVENENLKKENNLLKDAVNIHKNSKTNFVIADVVFFGNEAADFIIINKGEKDGLLQGDVAVLSDKILVGKIVEVYRDSSKVILISSSKSNIGARILSSGAVGIFNGRAGLSPEINFIPRDKTLEIGDLVVTSGFDGLYPAGYVLGKIRKIDFSEEKIFKRAYVDLAFDIYGITKLLIISGT